MYTLDDLKKAKEKLDFWNKKWDNYSGNNPNKYQSDIKSARREIDTITNNLKTTGIIELTEQEKLEKKLDVEFPNAKSKEIIEFNGQKYQRRFFPLEMSRSRKTVNSLGKSWEKL